MRDIKFRAWDTITNTMHTSIEELCFENGILIEVIFKKSWDGIGSCADEVVDWQNADQTILMQYTGLKDKNGVEIYDGDNVEVDTTGMNYQPEIVNGIVKYIDGCFTVEFAKTVYDVVLKCNRERLYVKCFTVNHALKVIGNIHEPEPHT